MTFEVGYTLAVCAAVVVLLLWERWPGELVALSGLVALVAGGVVSADRALLGLANPAVITIAGMFVLSAGLERTGGMDLLRSRLEASGAPTRRQLLLLVLPVVLGLSAFVNNTPIVVVFAPLLVLAARRIGAAASELLIPLSFASMLGGTCTLIGTSTNLIVSQTMVEAGLAPLGMFEIGAAGLPMAVVGLAYLLWIAPRILPRRPTMSSELHVPSREYVSEVVIREGSPLVGQRLASSAVARIHGVSVLELVRDGEAVIDPLRAVELRVGDRLLITAAPEQIRNVIEINGVEFDQPGLGLELVGPHEGHFVEAVVPPESALIGRPIGELGLRQRYGVAVLAIHRREANVTGGLPELPLAFGDILLVVGTRESCARLRRSGELIVLDDLDPRPYRRKRLPLAVGTLVGVVAATASGWLPVSAAVLLGCLVVVGGGCVETGEAYRSIRWNIVLLVAGMLGIGSAVDASGTADYLARALLGHVAGFGPLALVSALYLASALVTAFLSNAAAAVLVAPIALSTAAELGLNPRAAAVVVAFGASAAFTTPIGYQTNLFVYAMGGYRFRDFLRAGIPLVLLCWVVLLLLVPMFWPL